MQPAVLNAYEKQNTEYAIPLWLRDIQIKHALSRIKARVEPVEEPRSDPVAIVCFGPSLKDTWEQIRGFKNIITCSGAHKFLVDRGIIPTHHIEVDPRAHKVQLIGQPQKGTEYWISSTCHKAVFDHLEGYNVKLWHVFDGQYESARLIPAGEWALTGGCGVGLRAFTAATFCGFRDIHVFGMDGSESDDGRKHADDHPNEPVKHCLVEFPEGSGNWFRTTPGMLEAARQTVHEMEQLSKATFTFYGSGLVQAMVKEWKPKGEGMNVDAIKKPELISPALREMNALLHSENALYGASGHRHADTVKRLYTETQAESVLDYGCGKGTLATHLPFPIWEYDPAIPGKDELPRPADLVLCFDVLEHVEPEMIGNVLAHLAKLTKKVGYFVIASRPAKKTYADGRNAHLIVKDRGWWDKKLNAYFDVGQLFDSGGEVHAVVGPKTKGKHAGETVMKVKHDGTEALFYAPNDVCKWRAESLMTKEPVTIQWIDTFNPGEILWDVGANVGGYTVWASKRRGVEVYAFEPDAQNFALLCRNMTLNEVSGAAYCLALGDEDKLGTLFLSGQNPGGSCNTFGAEVGPDLKPRKGIKQGAVCVRGDTLTVPKPHHIKIDVDGLEHAVIGGMLDVIQQAKSLLIEVNGNLSEHRDMIARLESAGFYFDPAQVEASTRKDGPFKGCAEYVFRTVEDYVIQRIAAAEMIEHPFPHLFVEDVFPAPFYKSLRANLPKDGWQTLEEARGTKGYPERSVHSAPESVAWMRSGALRAALDAKFGVTSSHDETLLLRDSAGYQIPPHTDTPAKVVTCLFYLPADESLIEHGTTLYRPKDKGYTCADGRHHHRDGFIPSDRADFKPNSVLIFARRDDSFHGVEEFTGPGVRDILLFDTRG